MSLTSESLSARHDFRYLDLDVINGLKELARSLGPDPFVVNLGAGFGTSALALLESRDDLRLVTVDCQEEPTEIGSLMDERNSMREAGLFEDSRYEQIQGYSAEIGKSWDRGLLDMVFVDASHSYEACKEDALAWLPCIKENGIVAFHDYWARWNYGVIEAVDEVMEGYERIMLASCLIAFKVNR